MDLSRLDLVALARALDDHDPDREHFLDLADGSIWSFVFSESTDETRARHEEVLAGIGRTHARIPSVSPQEAFEDVEDFVEEIADDKVRETLFRGLERRGAFRNFREVLIQHPEEHTRWRARRKERTRRRLEEFLTSLGIDPAPHPTGAPG